GRDHGARGKRGEGAGHRLVRRAGREAPAARLRPASGGGLALSRRGGPRWSEQRLQVVCRTDPCGRRWRFSVPSDMFTTIDARFCAPACQGPPCRGGSVSTTVVPCKPTTRLL